MLHQYGVFLLGAFAYIISSSASAATIDFGIEATTPGSLSYAGGAAPLIGTGIEVDSIIGLGTPLNSGSAISCDSCVLSFTSGANTGDWDFGAGGTISLIGGVSAASIPGGTTLLSGSFDSATVVDFGSTFSFEILGASFYDTKDEDLLNYFGMPIVDYRGGLNLSFSMVGSPSVGDAFTSDELYSGDIVNNPVPVPPAVWLFGSGLLGLAGIARRKQA